MSVPYWSNSTLLFYIFLALVGMLCMNQVKGVSERHTFSRTPLAYVWWMVWVFFAVFRVVKPDIGGSDAIEYIGYFEHCNDTSISDIAWEHASSDFLFKWINKIIRWGTHDYHIYFLIVYGFMVYAFIRFLACFSKKHGYVIPFILIFYLYLRGFTSIRSNLALSIILLGLVSVVRGRKWQPYFFLICSLLIHKMSIVFALSIPFCHLFYGKMIEFKYILCFVGISGGIAILLRPLFVQISQLVELGGAYGSYVEIAMEEGTFTWVNDFGQMVLAAILWVKRKTVTKEISGDKGAMMLWNLCAFDIALVPVNQLLGMYRGYEFFYLARLCMWSLLLYMIFKKQTKIVKVLGNSIVFCIFMAWMIFRISRTFEDSCLMPYLFDFDYLFGI